MADSRCPPPLTFISSQDYSVAFAMCAVKKKNKGRGAAICLPPAVTKCGRSLLFKTRGQMENRPKKNN